MYVLEVPTFIWSVPVSAFTLFTFNIIKNIEPGTIFIVYLKEKEIYNGVVWSSLYSSSYDGIVIKKPLDYETREIQLQLGYPNENYFTGKDPRNNAELFKILKNFKKLEWSVKWCFTYLAV